jgi:hypothetical protein
MAAEQEPFSILSGNTVLAFHIAFRQGLNSQKDSLQAPANILYVFVGQKVFEARVDSCLRKAVPFIGRSGQGR